MNNVLPSHLSKALNEISHDLPNFSFVELGLRLQFSVKLCSLYKLQHQVERVIRLEHSFEFH